MRIANIDSLRRRLTNPIDLVVLNPQPLPPEEYARALKHAGLYLSFNPDSVLLSPQPLPPRGPARAVKQVFLPFNPDSVLLNPQLLSQRTLWPEVNSLSFLHYANQKAVQLNPQPLQPQPPKSSELLNFQLTLVMIIRG